MTDKIDNEQDLDEIVDRIKDQLESDGREEDDCPMPRDPDEPPFYYTSKASSSERDKGCEHLYWKMVGSEWVEISEEEYLAYDRLKAVYRFLKRTDGLDPEPKGETAWPHRIESYEEIVNFDTLDVEDKEKYWQIVGEGMMPYSYDGDPPIDPSEYDSLRDIPRTKNGNPHPTVKAKSIMEWLVDRLCDEGDTVLDPFAGTGTTGLAAIEHDCDAHLVELNSTGNYEPVIKARLEDAADEKGSDFPFVDMPDVVLNWEDNDGEEE